MPAARGGQVDVRRAVLLGRAFVEVPTAADVLDIAVPVGFRITWLVRGDGSHCGKLVDAVRRYLGLGPLDPTSLPAELPSDLDVEVWETPRYSSAGGAAGRGRHAGLGPRRPLRLDRGRVVAGEGLRRSLVTDLGVERRQVAFMGYWRAGVSMKS